MDKITTENPLLYHVRGNAKPVLNWGQSSLNWGQPGLKWGHSGLNWGSLAQTSATEVYQTGSYGPSTCRDSPKPDRLLREHPWGSRLLSLAGDPACQGHSYLKGEKRNPFMEVVPKAGGPAGCWKGQFRAGTARGASHRHIG